MLIYTKTGQPAKRGDRVLHKYINEPQWVWFRIEEIRPPTRKHGATVIIRRDVQDALSFERSVVPESINTRWV